MCLYARKKEGESERESVNVCVYARKRGESQREGERVYVYPRQRRRKRDEESEWREGNTGMRWADKGGLLY